MTEEMFILLNEFNKLYKKLKNKKIEDINREKFYGLEERLIQILEEYDYLVFDK